MDWSAGLKTQHKDFQHRQSSAPDSRSHNCFFKVCAIGEIAIWDSKIGLKPDIPSFNSCQHSVYRNNTESLDDKQDPGLAAKVKP